MVVLSGSDASNSETSKKAFDENLPSLSHSQRRKEKQQRSKQGRRLSADSWEAEVCHSLPDLRKQEQTQFITTSLQLRESFEMNTTAKTEEKSNAS